jgi:hypothetical protein
MGMYTLRLVFMLDDELEARKRAEIEMGSLIDNLGDGGNGNRIGR